MRARDIHAALRVLRREVRQWQEPVVGVVAKESRDPYLILIACVLSLRTKDRTTTEASRRLFALAGDPAGMLRLPVRKEEASWKSWGGVQTEAEAAEETARISAELSALQAEADFPL